MKMFMPSLGANISLSEDWEIDLYNEHRNNTFVQTCKTVLGAKIKEQDYLKVNKVVIPKNSVLTFDRIYLRKGVADYDSVTFTIQHPEFKKLKGRFWVKLTDVNKIEYDDFTQISPNEIVKKLDKALAQNKTPLHVSGIDFSKIITNSGNIEVKFSIPREEEYKNIKEISSILYVNIERLLKNDFQTPDNINLNIKIRDEINGIVKTKERVLSIKNTNLIRSMINSNTIVIKDFDTFTDEIVKAINKKNVHNFYYFKNLFRSMPKTHLDKIVDKTVTSFIDSLNDMGKTVSNIRSFMNSSAYSYLTELSQEIPQFKNVIKKAEYIEIEIKDAEIAGR